MLNSSWNLSSIIVRCLLTLSASGAFRLSFVPCGPVALLPLWPEILPAHVIAPTQVTPDCKISLQTPDSKRFDEIPEGRYLQSEGHHVRIRNLEVHSRKPVDNLRVSHPWSTRACNPLTLSAKGCSVDHHSIRINQPQHQASVTKTLAHLNLPKLQHMRCANLSLPHHQQPITLASTLRIRPCRCNCAHPPALRPKPSCPGSCKDCSWPPVPPNWVRNSLCQTHAYLGLTQSFGCSKWHLDELVPV